jgi:tape measure domain-containing protein
MTDIIQIELKLNDMLSAPLMKVAQATTDFSKRWDASKNHFANAAEAFKGGMNEMGKGIGKNVTSVNELRAKIEKLKQQHGDMNLANGGDIKRLRALKSEINSLEKTLHQLENLNGSRMSTWMGDIAQQIPDVVKNPLILAGAAAAAAVKKSMTQEMQLTNLSTVLGGKAQGSAMFGDISKLATETPFMKSQLIDATQLLLNMGISTDTVLPKLRMLGDISGGDAEKLDRLTLAFGQIASKGHLMGGELNQLRESGFDPDMNELYKKMEGGQISIDMVTAAMEASTGAGGRFHNAMLNASQTVSGKLSNALESVSDIAANVGMMALPAIAIGLDGINAAFGWLASNKDTILAPFQWIGDNFGLIQLGAELLAVAYVALNWQAMVGAASWSLFNGVLWLCNAAFSAGTVIMGIFNAVMALSPLTWFMAAIVGIVLVCIYLWNNFETGRAALTALGNAFISVFQNIGTLAKSVFGGLGDLLLGAITLDPGKIASGLASISGAFSTFGGAVGGAWDAGWEKGKVGFQNKKIKSNLGAANPDDAMLPTFAPAGGNAGMPSAYAALMPTAGGGKAPKGARASGGASHALGQSASQHSAAMVGGGGSGSRSINITINKSLVEQLTIQTTNLKEGAAEIKSVVERVIIEVLQSANALA